MIGCTVILLYTIEMYLYTDVSLCYYHGFMRRPVATGEYQEGGQQQQNKNNIKKQKKSKN